MTTTDKQLKNALSHLQSALKSLSSAKKRKPKKKRNPCSKNPRLHFPKTKAGRPLKTSKWLMTAAKRPPVRFRATKPAAYAKAAKYARSHRKVVLDGPK